MADGGYRTGRRPRQGDELTVGHLDLVAVAHPDDSVLGDAAEEALGLQNVDVRPAIFAAGCREHLCPEHLAGQLHAVADAQDRDAEREQVGITARRSRLVDTGGTARKDDSAGLQLGDAPGWQVVPNHLAEDILLTDAPGDQLPVLRAKVENENSFALGNNCRICYVKSHAARPLSGCPSRRGAEPMYGPWDSGKKRI